MTSRTTVKKLDIPPGGFRNPYWQNCNGTWRNVEAVREQRKYSQDTGYGSDLSLSTNEDYYSYPLQDWLDYGPIPMGNYNAEPQYYPGQNVNETPFFRSHYKREPPKLNVAPRVGRKASLPAGHWAPHPEYLPPNLDIGKIVNELGKEENAMIERKKSEVGQKKLIVPLQMQEPPPPIAVSPADPLPNNKPKGRPILGRGYAPIKVPGKKAEERKKQEEEPGAGPEEVVLERKSSLPNWLQSHWSETWSSQIGYF